MAEPGYELKDLSDFKYCSGSGECPVTEFSHNFYVLVQSTLGDMRNTEVMSHDSRCKGTCNPAEETRHDHKSCAKSCPTPIVFCIVL